MGYIEIYRVSEIEGESIDRLLEESMFQGFRLVETLIREHRSIGLTDRSIVRSPKIRAN
jgi:hypothetical protein